jgi:hypothetical protein
MEKVREFLKVAWIQRFWILSVVGTLAAVVCWMVASGKLQAEFTANKAQIDSKFADMQAIKSKDIHGNPGVNSREREEAKQIAKAVEDLWQNLFNAQREEVLKWPEAELGSDFVQEIDRKKFGAPISTRMRDRYLNYIKNRFDGLVEIINAKKMPVDGTSFGAMPMGREGMFTGEAGMDPSQMLGPDGLPLELDYLVEWLDQGNLRQQLEFAGVPSAMQIWVTQEDLWVYETLLRVIANTNKERGATRPDNTAIRIIQSLEVGAPAALAIAQESMILMPPDAALASGDMSAMGPEAGGMPMGRPEDGSMGAVDLDAALLASRYLDAEGKPIQDASAGTGAEFRRLPVRLVLQMDERWLPKVLVECANAPLPIEVQRLRINAEKSGMDKEGQPFDLTGGAGSSGMGGSREMGMPMGRPSSMPMGRPMGREMGGMGGMGMNASLSPAEAASLATVEIQGVVYIYLPPDKSILTVPGDEAASPDALAAGDGGVVR